MSFIFVICVLQIFVVYGQIDILENIEVTTDGERLITSTFPLINSNNYWLIDRDNPDVSFQLVSDSSTYTFLITSIQIQVFDQMSFDCTLESTINSADYLISYEIGEETRVLNLATKLTTISGNIASVEIEPIPADSIKIVKRVGTIDTFCMRYGLAGYQIARVSVVNYDISLPNLQMDNEYTGLCGSRFCIGGKGRLTDGITDVGAIASDGVGWSCQSDKDVACIFNLRIQFSRTAYIDRVVIFGVMDGSALLPGIEFEDNSDINITHEFPINNNVYSITASINSKENDIRFSFTVETGTNMVLSEIAVFTDDDVNIAVENIGYNYISIIPVQEQPTSSRIANFQNENAFVAPTMDDPTDERTTIPIITTTTISTTTTELTTTMDDDDKTTFQSTIPSTQTELTTVNPKAFGDTCMTKSIFFSVIGVLSIFIITMLLNSIIIIVLLARNNRKVRRKLHELQNTKSESFKNFAENLPKNIQEETVFENNITINDVYDSLNARTTSKQRDSGFDSPNDVNTTNIRNSTYCINHNFFNQHSLSTPMANKSCSRQAVPDINIDRCVQDENEVPMEDNIAYVHDNLPQICINTCQESLHQAQLGVPMMENVSYISARNASGDKTCQESLQQTQLGVPMMENVSYISARNASGDKTCQESLQQTQLGVPMMENASYISARNALGDKMQNGTKEALEISDMKHIYASISNDCCIALPECANEFNGYNVLKHK